MDILFNLFIITGLVLMAGCQSAAVSAGNPPTETSESVVQITAIPTDEITQTPSPESDNDNNGVSAPGETPSPEANAKKVIQLSKESLAKKFKISVDDIHLSSVDAVFWPDASLGCPQPGVVYAQVITPGYQIMLEGIGQTYSYHTDDTERVILCEIRPPDEIFLPP